MDLRRTKRALLVAALLTTGILPTSAMAQETAADIEIHDGEPWVLYQRFQDGLHLRMIRPDGSGDHEIAVEVPGAKVHPDWSPDGQRIAFSVEDMGQIWVIDADGSDALQIVDCIEPCVLVDAPAWSPDGGSIAFLRIIAPADALPYTQVQVLDLATEELRTVFEPEPAIEAPWYMRWSPDGERLVISLEHYESADSDIIDCSVIAVLDVDDASPEPLVLTDPTIFATYPDWSPDGEHILFTTYDLGFRDGGSYADRMPASNLYTIAPDGSDLQQLTFNEPGESPVRDGTASGDLATQPTWTPDGEGITFVHVSGDEWPGWGMAMIDADGSDMRPAAGDTFLYGTHPRLRPTPGADAAGSPPSRRSA